MFYQIFSKGSFCNKYFFMVDKTFSRMVCVLRLKYDFFDSWFYGYFFTRKKEGIDVENAEIRNLLDTMQEQVVSFRGSL